MNEPNRLETIDEPDLSTLSWCLGEIRESLGDSEARLRAQQAAGMDDLSELRGARAALHQAHGALAIVDLAGVAQITGEAETLLDLVEREQLALSDELIAAVGAAYGALGEYLDGLLLGDVPQPLFLYPYYAALLQLRAAERIHPADLFSPPVSARLVLADGPIRELSVAELAAARAGFERGLLKLLRDPADGAAVLALHQSIDAIGASQIGAAHPTFWQVALAYFEGLRDGRLKLDVHGKRLLARLNLQLRRSISDGAPVAERLMKDTLFALARADDDDDSQAEGGLFAQVRRAFRLHGAVPRDFEQPRFGRVDKRALAAGKEAIGRAKLAWEKLARGSSADLATYAQAIAALRTAAAGLPFGGLRALVDALGEAARTLALSQPVPNETLALEAASALLFVEQLFDRALKDADTHDARGFEMAQRMSEVLAGKAPEQEVPDWLRELAAAAQERLTMATFIGEAQGNLRATEQALDAFFRDATQRADLPQTVRQLYQVAGALQLLGHQDAAAAASVVAEHVQRFVADEAAPSPEECEAVAGSLGAIGFFVEGLQQQPGRAGTRFAFDADSGRFTATLAEPVRAAQTPVVVALNRRAGDAASAGAGAAEGAGASTDTGSSADVSAGGVSSTAASMPGSAADLQPGSQSDASSSSPPSLLSNSLSNSLRGAALETSAVGDPVRDVAAGIGQGAGQESAVTAEGLLAEHAQRASDLFDALAAAPADDELRAQLRQALAQMRDDAILADDGLMKGRAVDGLALLDAHEQSLSQQADAADVAALRNPLADLPGIRSAVTQAVPEELPRDEAAIDSELLEIFLGEAEEVLAAIDEAAGASRDAPSEQAFLTTIRRGFHTLKGSSRMVGLAEFGEAGWAMEQVLNLWLSEERPGTSALYELIDLAGARFAEWVAALQAGDMRPVDPAALIAAATALREGVPHQNAFAALARAEMASSPAGTIAAAAAANDAAADVALAEGDALDAADAAAQAKAAEDAADAGDAGDAGDAAEPAVEVIELVELADVPDAGVEPPALEAFISEARATDDEGSSIDEIDAIEVVEAVEAVEAVEVVDAIETVEAVEAVEVVEAVEAVEAVELAEAVEVLEAVEATDIEAAATGDAAAAPEEVIEADGAIEFVASEAVEAAPVGSDSASNAPIEAGAPLLDESAAAEHRWPEPFDLSAPIAPPAAVEAAHAEAADESADEVQ
ncbi:MAG: Hpt domain-containing protein, partial [Burkholderiaceae bacterium]